MALNLMLIVTFTTTVNAFSPPPPPPSWSKKYRDWSYHQGKYDGFVVPPIPTKPDGSAVLENAKLTDCAVAWQAAPDVRDGAGAFRMFYTINDGPCDKGGQCGYRTALAISSDLVNWDFSPGVVFDRGSTPARFDYGGVTFGGPLYVNASVTAPRLLRQHASKLWVAYGAYPVRGGYESGNGGEGLAWSNDGGDSWHRASETIPFVPGGGSGSAAWEDAVVYQPNLLVANATVFDFYNAAGTNARGAYAEQSGVASVSLGDFPGIDGNTSLWRQSASNPVLPSGPPGSFDTRMASDPKVWWDDELGCWIMFYFGLGDGSAGHADIMIARSDDLLSWEKDPAPLYTAGGHPAGIDAQHAHKISLLYHEGTGYLYYTAVGPKGRGIALLTSKPLR